MLLSALPVDEYYRIFKSHKGDDLRKIINVCLQFDRIGSVSAAMQEISRRAKEALRRIGGESAINASRVRHYGINIEPALPGAESNPE